MPGWRGRFFLKGRRFIFFLAFTDIAGVHATLPNTKHGWNTVEKVIKPLSFIFHHVPSP